MNETPSIASENIKINILAFNDLHGNLDPPGISVREKVNGEMKEVPAGGAAYLAAAIQHYKKQNPFHAVVSAGDMIGASPLTSALFLDESTIDAVNAMEIDFNAVGNHEFDKGAKELIRMRKGGCEKFTRTDPCQVNKQFSGANFDFLAANVKLANQETLFPAFFIKSFQQGPHQVKVGFIGMTLKATPTLVTPDGIFGLKFEDEAETANSWIPKLKAQGVSVFVLVIHEGGVIQGGHNDASCPGLSGDILPILNKLDSAFDVVVSGHTHRAYACDYSQINPAKPFLLTSAGQYGTFLTNIELSVDARSQKILSKKAYNAVVQSEVFQNNAGTRIEPSAFLPFYGKHTEVEKIIHAYRLASEVQVQKVISHLPGAMTRQSTQSGESALGNMIADAQWASSAGKNRDLSDFALMNPGGVRADLNVQPGGGTVNFGQLFKIQPFGNTLVVKKMSGQHIKDLLEHQYANMERPKVLFPSENLRYEVDFSQAYGHRIKNIAIRKVPIGLTKDYHVTVNSFLASGGDGFFQFKNAQTISGGELDVDALSEYLRSNPGLLSPPTNRIQVL